MSTTRPPVPPGSVTVDGTRYPIRYARRGYRSFSSARGKTYTWVEVEIDGEWQSVGDPWPTATPKRTEVQEAAEERVRRTRSPVNTEQTA